ncbi:MAG TPA: ABC transporter ATP-binding protein [Abditibacteriaceae bacterium]|jgi:subfamily B ATP-binding cassette protein MsbA
MNNLKRLLPYLQGQRSTIIKAVISMVLSGLVSIAMLYLFEKVLKQILNVDAARPDMVMKALRRGLKEGLSDSQIMLYIRPIMAAAPNRGPDLQRLNYFVLIMLGVGILAAVTDFFQTYFTTRLGQRVLTRLRSDLFAHFQSLSVGFFERKRTGELMSRMTNDLSSLQGLMTQAITTTVRAPIATVGALGYMFSKNWQLSLLVLTILPPMAFLINRAGKQIRKSTAMMQRQIGELTNYLQEKMSAMRLIQTFGTQDYEIATFEKVNQESYRRAMVPARIKAVLSPSIEFLGLLGVMLALWYGAHSKPNPEELIVFLFAGHRSAMNLKALASLTTMFRSAEAATDRLFEMLDTKPEVQDTPGAKDLRERKIQGHLVFDNVRFAYGNGPEVLHGISFEVKPGEVVALAGLSGSGKTTISNLVPRLYDPTGGSVLLDGLDLRSVTLKSLRSYIGAVPQETTLFHGTIRENIAYARPDATLEEVIEAARQAHADEFIQKLPDKYDTPIGERGGRLSGGQRQRIAIARALLRDPRILILDEATSALDAESESLVQDALSTLMKGRTTLIIAHRFSTIRHANKILVLEQGNIAESGTHDELLQQDGIYSRLYHMQTAARSSDDDQNNETGANNESSGGDSLELDGLNNDDIDLQPDSKDNWPVVAKA